MNIVIAFLVVPSGNRWSVEKRVGEQTVWRGVVTFADQGDAQKYRDHLAERHEALLQSVRNMIAERRAS